MLLLTRRQRSTLDVWIIASLALLECDNLLTLAGGARGSIGWIAGRLVALVSAGAAIWGYVREVERLRAHAEAALEDVAVAEARLHAALRLESLGQLTGAIAHDFNNLLLVITNSFDVVRRRADGPDPTQRAIDAGLQATARGARLTRQLLTFARRQNLRPAAISPNAKLRALEGDARRMIGPMLGLTLALDDAAHPVLMDPAEFEAAIVNLITNAQEALLPKGGTIAISSRNQVLGVSAATDHLRPGAYTVVAVADNGPGMSPDIAARAFDPFFTTKDFGKGAGLGLSQVYGFARASGGDAIILTRPGFGTQVELWLPRMMDGVDAIAAPVVPDIPVSRPTQDGEVVLAVEDEPDVLTAVVDSLSDLGYQVLTAANAAGALEQIRTAPQLDLLFSDIVMPGGMNGVQLAHEARKLRPGIRILLTSGYANLNFTGDDVMPPNVELLQKPYRHADLASRLQLAMHAA